MARSITYSLSLVFAGVLLFVAGLSEATARQAAQEMAVLRASDQHPNDFFGWSVSMSGRRAAVGAFLNNTGFQYAGSVYLYEEDASGAWTQALQIQASDRAQDVGFGYSVSLDGDQLLVGAYSEDRGDMLGPLAHAGAAYLYAVNPTTGQCVEKVKLTASDAADRDQFGNAVALEANTAVIGARWKQTGAVEAGAVYIFERGAFGVWNEVKKLVPPSPTPYGHFGTSVAVSGTRVIVGEHRQNNLKGAAYIYERDAAGAWILRATLKAGSLASAFFGQSVALQGDIAMVGAPEGNGRLGWVYVFERQSDGQWVQTAELTPSPAQIELGFGYAVAMDGDLAVIGSNIDERTTGHDGAAWVFKRNEQGQWVQTEKIQASNRNGSVDQYGWSVSIDHDCVVIGAFLGPRASAAIDAGTAYVVDLSSYLGGATLAETNSVPSDFRLEQNWPNPFNPTTTIAYALDEAGSVDLSVLDPLGRVVRQIDGGFRAAGRYEIGFEAADLPTGIYTYRLSINDRVTSRRMILLR